MILFEVHNMVWHKSNPLQQQMQYLYQYGLWYKNIIRDCQNSMKLKTNMSDSVMRNLYLIVQKMNQYSLILNLFYNMSSIST